MKMKKEALINKESRHYRWTIKDLRWDELGFGESMLSNTIEWDFPKSLGKSKWALQLFPKGQYGIRGQPQRSANVYIKLLNCEKKDLLFNATFKFIITAGGNHMVNEYNANFKYEVKRERWIGHRIMILHPRDTVTIQCICTEHVLVEEKYFNNNSSINPKSDIIEAMDVDPSYEDTNVLQCSERLPKKKKETTEQSMQVDDSTIIEVNQTEATEDNFSFVLKCWTTWSTQYVPVTLYLIKLVVSHFLNFIIK